MRIQRFIQKLVECLTSDHSYNGQMPTSLPRKTPLKLAVLVSASGTTLQNLIDRITAQKLFAEIVLVISSHSEAYALERANQAGIPREILTRKMAGSRQAFGSAIFEKIRSSGAELVCLAGFLELLPIPSDFTNRVINIHPSLVPAFCGKGFYGLKVHQAALEMGVKVSGCTVHFADNEFDHGPIILQQCVPVAQDDTAESLAARIFAAECEVFPAAIELFGSQRLQVEGKRVRISPADLG